MTESINLTKILELRGNTYGDFSNLAITSQKLKTIINEELEVRNKKLPALQKEALEMVCHKIARIINGDNNYIDSWIDIGGYVKLVSDNLQKPNS